MQAASMTSNRVRSSRRLEAEANRNIEVMWLLRRLRPHFTTIADFRRDNAKAFRQVFRSFVLLCRDLDLFGQELLAIDGTRIKAVNNKDRNHKQRSLESFIQQAYARLDDYLRRLDESDAGDVDRGGTGGGSRTDNLDLKIAALREKRGRYFALMRPFCASQGGNWQAIIQKVTSGRRNPNQAAGKRSKYEFSHGLLPC